MRSTIMQVIGIMRVDLPNGVRLMFERAWTDSGQMCWKPWLQCWL